MTIDPYKIAFFPELVYSSLESSNLIGQLEGSRDLQPLESRSTTCSIPPSRHLVNLVKSAISLANSIATKIKSERSYLMTVSRLKCEGCFLSMA